MDASDKTRRQLLEEIRILRSQNAKLERDSRQMPGSGFVPPRSNSGKVLMEKLIFIGVGLASFSWILESAIHAFIFHNGSFFDQILPSSTNELWMRLVICFILIWFSIYAQTIVKQLRLAKVKLQQSHDDLEFRVKERTAELAKTNEQLQVEITERKKAEGALRAERDKLRALMDGINRAGIGIDIIGADYKVLFQNKILEEECGDLRGKCCYEHYMELEEPCDQCPAMEAITEKKTVSTEQESGGRYYQVFSAPLPDTDGTTSKAIEIVLDITDRKKAEEKLIENQALLRSLVSELTMTEERERKEIAGLLHDDLIQRLAMCKMRVDELGKSETLADRSNSLDEIGKSIREMISGARSLTFDLCSPVLYDIGLEAAIRDWLDREVSGKYGITFDFTDDGQQRQLNEDLRITLYRAVRELCTNVIKHSKAQKAKISIRSNKNIAEIIVEDDGGGFNIDGNKSDSSERGGLGLFGIRERLNRFGADMNIESEADSGTKVTIMVPLNL